tara:strand:- start:2233 stop:2940 length:708 start_codon:yes stop_codon:yes gene_type:complete
MDQNNSNPLSFQDLMEASALRLSEGGYLTSFDILFSLIVSFLCGLFISWIYRMTFQGVIYQKSFNISIIIVSVITSSIVMAISGNLMLALGMVGALSIVRFRAAIKEPLDIVFLFWAITVGVANGVAFFKLSIITTLFVALVIYFLMKIDFKISTYMLILSMKKDINSEKEITKILQDKTKSFAIRTKNINDNHIELIYEIKLNKNDSSIVEDISKIKLVKDVSMVSHSNNMLDQ